MEPVLLEMDENLYTEAILSEYFKNEDNQKILKDLTLLTGDFLIKRKEDQHADSIILASLKNSIIEFQITDILNVLKVTDKEEIHTLVKIKSGRTFVCKKIYFKPLFKLWAKNTNTTIMVNLEKYRETICKELSEIPGYNKVREELKEFKSQKCELMGLQKYEACAQVREKEQAFVENNSEILSKKQMVLKKFIQQHIDEYLE